MPARLTKISYPIPADHRGQAFSNSDDLLNVLVKESSGHYLVGSQGMWHGGIHITEATAPWCALSADTEAEKQYCREPYKGEQFIRCMADGEIVAYRVDKAYPSIPWRNENLSISTSFVLVKHTVQPGEKATSGLTFYTLYMNLAPFAAYVPQGGERNRKTAERLSYYSSAENVQKGIRAKSGTMPEGIGVTLGDKVITRSSDRRQFSEVTLMEEIKDTAGTTLNTGTSLWILSDRGNLKAASFASSSPPPWWAKCTPAYSTRPGGVVACQTLKGWKYYLSSDDVQQNKKEGELTANFPLSYEPDNTAQQVVRPSDKRTFSLVTLGKDVGKQKKGDRVWVVSDGDSLTPLSAAGEGTQPTFGEVIDITSAPIKINTGDGIGHMGFVELPEDNGKRARYQVHIECLSMDSRLPTFLTNPEKVGEENPVYLKYPAGAALFLKNAQGEMEDSQRKTRAPGILTLSTVPVVAQDGQAAYYQIRPEGGYLAAASIQRLSQYALGELGFITLDKAPESFDLIDGVKHPNNVVKGILEQLYQAARAETRTSHILNKYNYQRLLDKIDSN